jgi:carbon-monoxide dehydrogenase medium subunit
VKAATVAYERPTSLAEALALLDGDDFVRVLSGGQSLLPMLGMRLMRPEVLVDIASLGELRTLERSGDGLAVGALVTYRQIERSELVTEVTPLLQQAVRYVGDPQIRNRGTVGGSIAHGDPTAELPLACLTVGCEVEVASVAGSRRLSLGDFLLGPYETALDANEMVTGLHVRAQRGRGAFAEATRRHNDFAIVSVAAVGTPDGGGRLSDLSVGFGGVADTVVVAPRTAAALTGVPLTEEALSAAAELCQEEIDPSDDLRASSKYRRHLAGEYLRRAVTEIACTEETGVA